MLEWATLVSVHSSCCFLMPAMKSETSLEGEGDAGDVGEQIDDDQQAKDNGGKPMDAGGKQKDNTAKQKDGAGKEKGDDGKQDGDGGGVRQRKAAAGGGKVCMYYATPTLMHISECKQSSDTSQSCLRSVQEWW